MAKSASTEILDILKDLAPQLNYTDEDRVKRFISYSQSEINESLFKGNDMDYKKAVAYLTAHKLSDVGTVAHSSKGVLKSKSIGSAKLEYDHSYIKADSASFYEDYKKLMKKYLRTTIILEHSLN